MKRPIPESVREQLKKAGQIRAAQMTKEDRQKYGRKAWQTRLKNALDDGNHSTHARHAAGA